VVIGGIFAIMGGSQHQPWHFGLATAQADAIADLVGPRKSLRGFGALCALPDREGCDELPPSRNSSQGLRP
jgi:hypothetical protein